MKLPRSSGVLLHITSLPGPYGIGELGPAAYRFVDFLADAGQRIWQVLPLGHTGYGDSPYQCFSAFAGNPLLLNMDWLADEGLVDKQELAQHPPFPEDTVDYGWVIQWKSAMLARAYTKFLAGGSGEQREQFEAFRRENAHWLDDYTLFMALKQAHEYAVWTEWEPELAQRDPAALEAARVRLAEPIAALEFAQFHFFRHWDTLRQYCRERGLTVVGDIAIYVAHDSADVWAHPEVFQLDRRGNARFIGGVPPDYFSKTGQRWGNPIYDWAHLAETGYAWWIERVRAALRLFDVIRVDHFRGFEAYWEVPGRARTAAKGRWVPGPQDALFEALRAALGDDLPIIAENLGVITPEVEALRERFSLPGMAVLQFGLGYDAQSSGFPPHAYTRDLVAYTGTHDNDTALGWWKSLGRDSARRDFLKRYLVTTGRDFHWACIRALMASVADTVIFPLQDLLGVDNAGRMNRPGKPSGNWRWRFRAEALTPEIAQRLRMLTETYARA